MTLVVRFACLFLLVAALFSCGNDTAASAKEEEILNTEISGGDTSVQVLKLEYIDLDLPERQYLVFRQELSLLDMNGFLGMESEALSVAVARAGVAATGPMTSLFYLWDTQRGWGDAAVALPVAAGTKLPPYVTITLPATKAIALDMEGSYEALSAMHVSLSKELERRGLKPTLPSIEEYPVGPLTTEDPQAFRTRIIYPYETPAQ